MDNLLAQFVEMCELANIPDSKLVSIRVDDDNNQPLIAYTMPFSHFKDDFNQHKIY